MSDTTGILAYGAHVPYRRLDRSSITSVMGRGGGRGHRSVASFDEDTSTMGVAAARRALAATPATPEALWFSTVAPAYTDKTNATLVHAALRLAPGVAALDFGGAARSAVGALRTACEGGRPTLVVSSDIRVGLPTGPEETTGGDAAAAVLCGSAADGPLLAGYLGGATVTEEFTERWRSPGDAHSRTWEDRFAEQVYRPLVDRAWAEALGRTGLTAADVDLAVVTGLHARATGKTAGSLGVAVADDLSGTVGNTGAAHPALALAAALDTADAVGQIAARADLAYPTYLAWRGLLEVQPPNRPEPNRPSASAAHRRTDWKHGFVGSTDASTGITHLPPSRVGIDGGTVDDMAPTPMADARGTIVTFTIDRLAYSPSPPVVFAVVDFDGGGRMPVELTDVDPDEVSIGGRVEMTFRRLFTADGLHNYFWKARPVRGGAGEG